MKWARARTHPTIICSAENFNRIFCILHHISRIKSNLDDWKLHSEQFVIISMCLVMSSWRLYLYIRYVQLCCLFALVWAHARTLLIFVNFRRGCNLITLANFHATLHIWLERFIIIAHPVKCWFISYKHVHNFDNTLIFVVLFALFLLLIFDVIRAEDRCIMHVYMRCDFNLIIIIANMQCEWYDLVELIFFEWNWMNIWDATICNCRCKWKEKV